MSERITRGHILAVLPATEWHHCNVCGGSGFLDQPNSLASDCPTTTLQTLHLNNIYKNRLDYVRGKWVQRNVR